MRPAKSGGFFSKKRTIFACSVACVFCSYGWITREVSLELWIMSRLCETDYFRTIFNPHHFSVAPHETPEEAMKARQDDAARLMAMGTRILAEDMAEVHDVTIPVKGGEIPLRVYVPHSGTAGRSLAYKGVLLWMHGGGWLFGTVDAHDNISRDIAEATRMIVVSVGYRLAPEVKFPGPVKDGVSAIRWAKKNIWAFGGDPHRIAIVGESSGANLAITSAMLDSKTWIPFVSRKSDLCAVVAASAPVSYEHAMSYEHPEPGSSGGGEEEDDGEWRSYKRYYNGYGLEGGQMKGYWEWYLRSEKDGRHPLASPIRAKKWLLKGLPPVLLMRAEHEVLWDEISEMGRIIAGAGQEVTEIQEKGCIHGLFAKGIGSCGSESLQHTVDFLREHCS